MKIQLNLFVNRAIQMLLIYFFAVSFAFGFFLPFMAIFITDFISGATLKTIGIGMAFYAIFKSIVQLPLSRKLDKHLGEKDDFFALLAGGLIGILYPFTLLFISKVWQLYLVQIIIGIGDGALMAAFYGLFARHTDKGSEGFEWSLFSVGGATISFALSGVLGGIIADAFGIKTLFFIAGILNIAAVGILFLLYPHLDGMRKKAIVPLNVPLVK